MKKININFIKVSLVIIAVLFISAFKGYTQETTTAPKEDKPVRSPFESGILIDNQTMVIPVAHTLEFIIHHRFGTIENGKDDLWGLYAPSNIRLGLNYSVFNKLMVGIGTTKNKKYQDLQWKYNLIEQTRSGKIPVTVTYFGNAVVDTRSKDILGASVDFTNRLSFFNELIITRKFTDAITLQVSGNFTHFNLVEDGAEHDKIGVSVGGRYKFSPQTSFIFNYNNPLDIESIREHTTLLYESKPDIALGVEISTGTHVFQIFIASAAGIINQENMMYNLNEFNDKGILLGFNITRLWSF